MIYKFESNKPSRKIMLSVHVDTLGAIVKKIDPNVVRFDLIGGCPPEYIIGNYCTIHTFDGKEITGTIVHSNPAVHVNKELYDKKFKVEDLIVRPDIKLKGDNDKLSDYIEIGNFISFDPRFQIRNGFVKSRHLDDKASAGILLNIVDILIEKMKKPGFKLDANIYCFFNVTEETGQGIAGYPEIDDFLVVDMGALGEGLSGDEFNVSICVKDATGPYHYDFPHYGSDGSGALRAGADVRVALIGPGVAASHGHERTHVDSLLGVHKLVLKYLLA
jgi:putative aminopeptidase FrvX